MEIGEEDLGLDPQAIGNQDIQQILSGLSSIISGMAALRTHASSAHGRGSFRYVLQRRHALLAIHSAHTLALFIIQTGMKSILEVDLADFDQTAMNWSQLSQWLH